MIKDGVIVDTSVLISFFKGTDKYVKEVTKLLQTNRLFITGIVIAELLQGIKNPEEEKRVSFLIDAIGTIELTTDIWIKAGHVSSSLRRRGISLPLTDVAIAALAIENNLSVFTIDKHYKKIPDLKIYKMG